MKLTIEDLEKRISEKYYEHKLDLEKASFNEWYRDGERRRELYKNDVREAFGISWEQHTFLHSLARKYVGDKLLGDRQREIDFFKMIFKLLEIKPLEVKHRDNVDFLERLAGAVRLVHGGLSAESIAQRPFGEILDSLLPNGITFEIKLNGKIVP